MKSKKPFNVLGTSFTVVIRPHDCSIHEIAAFATAVKSIGSVSLQVVQKVVSSHRGKDIEHVVSACVHIGF